MKLTGFRAADENKLGMVVGGRLVIDLTAAMIAQGMPAARAPRTTLELIEGGMELFPHAQRVEAALKVDPRAFPSYGAEQIAWNAPVERPSKICCLALNNSSNPGRILQGPGHPAVFIKPSSALVGHEGAIECQPHYGRTHPEPELAVIIGKKARKIRAEDAYDYVFGYTIHNDITSPTMRGEDTFHYRAIHPQDEGQPGIKYVDTWVSYPGRYKCSDTFACMGPWVVTRDEIPDPHALNVSCSHQGRVVVEDNTANLTHKVPEVLAFLSSYMTLLPGDIVSMGTALKQADSGNAVQNVDLNRLGGPVSITIEGIGTLTNSVVHI
jgi:2-keto-4-pentenoate hydratase/2-oxohepta-3-ene-1,7-dioic acid hydratase in catechol pathway